MQHSGLIYGYQNYVGQVQSPAQLKRRIQTHLRKHPDWGKPIVLETVFGKNRKDLLFNLAWAETIWIFKRHTLNRIWSQGRNKCIPKPMDCREVALLNSQENRIRAASIGRMRLFALHPDHGKDLGSRCPQGARIRGGKTRAKQGAAKLLIPFTSNPAHQSFAGKIGGAIRALTITREEQSKAGKIGGPIACHVRWHVRRGLLNPNCSLCNDVCR